MSKFLGLVSGFDIIKDYTLASVFEGLYSFVASTALTKATREEGVERT